MTLTRGKASKPTKRLWRTSKADSVSTNSDVTKVKALSFLSHFFIVGSAERQSCVKPTGMQPVQKRPPWSYSVMLFVLPSVMQRWTV